MQDRASQRLYGPHGRATPLPPHSHISFRLPHNHISSLLPHLPAPFLYKYFLIENYFQ